jgi:hypothetical protein
MWRHTLRVVSIRTTAVPVDHLVSMLLLQATEDSRMISASLKGGWSLDSKKLTASRPESSYVRLTLRHDLLSAHSGLPSTLRCCRCFRKHFRVVSQLECGFELLVLLMGLSWQVWAEPLEKEGTPIRRGSFIVLYRNNRWLISVSKNMSESTFQATQCKRETGRAGNNSSL